MDHNEAIEEEVIEIPSQDEEERVTREQTRTLTDEHCTKEMKKAKTGKKKGTMIIHFQCKYCDKAFQGPSNGTALKHLRAIHPKKCPDLLTQTPKPKRGFFDAVKMKLPFDADIFIGKLLTWIT